MVAADATAFLAVGLLLFLQIDDVWNASDVDKKDISIMNSNVEYKLFLLLRNNNFFFRFFHIVVL